MLPLESGLVIFVPEAEQLVGPFREQFDPAAGLGVPAHITLLYPFKPPDEITTEDLEQLGRIFAHSAVISFTLIGTSSFGSHVLFLAPAPAEPFIDLTDALVRAYPERRPYGGRFAAIVPHLTVAARIASAEEFELISRTFAAAAQGSFPITARATAVKLLDTSSGRWAVRSTFALGAESCAAA